MKAIIPVAGAGVNLRPHTYTQPKALIPVAGKAIIGYIIEELKQAGVHDFIFVVGYLGEKIETYVNKRYPDIHAEFVPQIRREGVGHAVFLAKEHVADEKEILILLGDTILDTEIEAFISNPNSCLGIKKVENPGDFGVAETDKDGKILKVTEKPQFPKSNQALVGIYKIKETALLFKLLEEMIQNEKRTHNEFQLTDAIMEMIRQGVHFDGKKVKHWYDCGKKDILLETNSILLKKTRRNRISHDKVENSAIIEPVNIPKNAVIRNSIIGPNVSIGENALITGSIVEHSIIGNYTTLSNVMLSNSVIGSDVEIKGMAKSLNIGDNTQIDFSG